MTNFKYDKIKPNPYLESFASSILCRKSFASSRFPANKYMCDKIIIKRFDNKHSTELKNILNLFFNIKSGKNDLFYRMNIITKYYEYIIQNIDDPSS